MNLKLPFEESDTTVLDAHVADIDRELDALFLDAVEGELERLRREREAARDDAAA